MIQLSTTFSALNLGIIFIKTSTCVSQFSNFLNEIMNERIKRMNESMNE